MISRLSTDTFFFTIINRTEALSRLLDMVSGNSGNTFSRPGLSSECAAKPHVTLLIERIANLRRTNPDIERWWHDHAVHDYEPTQQTTAHPVGLLHFALQSVTAPRRT